MTAPPPVPRPSPYPGTLEPFDQWPPDQLLAIADKLNAEAVSVEAREYGAAHGIFITASEDISTARGMLADAGMSEGGAIDHLNWLVALADGARDEMAAANRTLTEHAGAVAAARSEIGWVRWGASMVHTGVGGPWDGVVGGTIDDAAKWFVIDNVQRYQTVSNDHYLTSYPVYDPPVQPVPAATGGAGSAAPGSGAPGSAGPGWTPPPWTPPAVADAPALGGAGGGFPPGGAAVPPGGAIPPGGSTPPGGTVLPGAAVPPGVVAPPVGTPRTRYPGPPAAGGAVGVVPQTPRWPGGVPPRTAVPDARWRPPSTGSGFGRSGGPGPGVPPRDGMGGAVPRSGAPGPGTAGPGSGPPAGRPGTTGFGGVPFAGAGVGRDGESHARPSWLLQDDPEAVWFAGLP
ncbi:MAG: hypothetical protein AB7J25_30640, partial [Pseudonocardia sp.]